MTETEDGTLKGENYREITKEVGNILSNIKFSEHSCIDMGWEFNYSIKPGSDSFGDDTLIMIRTSFKRKDINSGKTGTGWGRWHTTPYNGATEKSIVMTAWVCVKMIIEHEMLEGFEYHGKKVFDPHKSLDALVYPEILPNGR